MKLASRLACTLLLACASQAHALSVVDLRDADTAPLASSTPAGRQSGHSAPSPRRGAAADARPAEPASTPEASAPALLLAGLAISAAISRRRQRD